jgi:hypothetical protein
MFSVILRPLCPVTLLFLLSCHDAPRTNPFDPALTPAVELSVALDDTAGTATLTWTPYEGQQPFREYQVLRREEKLVQIDTVARLAEQDQTFFADTTLKPEVDYLYWVEVVNQAGFPAPSNQVALRSFSVPESPLVEVQADPRRGWITLRWQQYRGPDFAGYEVRRRRAEDNLRAYEVVAQRGAVADTVWTDESAAPGVTYFYWVVTLAAGQERASEAGGGAYLLPAVEIAPPDFVSRPASASLRWSRYLGPRFQKYQVLRRSAELAPQVIKESADLADTSLVDSGLSGNTEYFYKVVVETERGEEVESAEMSGRFHELVDTWPLNIEEGEYVRLYREGEGITALVASSSQVRLFFFDTQGTLLAEQVLLDNPDLNIDPRGATTSLGLEGQRFLSLNTGRNTLQNILFVWRFDAEGKPVFQETPVFADSLERLSPDHAKVQGEILLRSSSLGGIPGTRKVSFDNVVVSKSGQVLFAEDFDDADLGEWDEVDLTSMVAEGKLSGRVVFARKTDPSWQDFRLEAEVVLPKPAGGFTITNAGIKVGTIAKAGSHFLLNLDIEEQKVGLLWVFTPPEGSALKGQTKDFLEPFPILADVPYRLGLEAAEGRVRAWVGTPKHWSFEQEEDTPWVSLAGIGESLVLLAGRQSYRINPTEALDSNTLLESPASELRIWETSGTAQYWMGACLPEQQLAALVKTGVSARGQLIGLPSLVALSDLVRPLGSGVGQQAGAFLYPLSFDGSPDGRVYVLDAGNARIQVFDEEGQYLTQWGHKGSDEGEFDFGSGRVPEDFAGSVAVDGEGYIYVADVGNRRIQKFAR